jgi:hypothetical protein
MNFLIRFILLLTDVSKVDERITTSLPGEKCKKAFLIVRKKGTYRSATAGCSTVGQTLQKRTFLRTWCG